MWETRVQSLGWEDPLEKGKATHSSILGFPCGSAGKESAYNVRDQGLIPGFGRSLPFPREGKSYPTPVFWPGEFHGLYSPWGRKESDITERLSLHFLKTPKLISPLDILCGFIVTQLVDYWIFPSQCFKDPSDSAFSKVNS